MGIWSEVNNEYVDESDIEIGFAEMSVDAWKTNDKNEEGKPIAKVLAIKTETENIVRVVYIDNRAREDKYAQEVIQESVKIMEQYEF